MTINIFQYVQQHSAGHLFKFPNGREASVIPDHRRPFRLVEVATP